MATIRAEASHPVASPLDNGWHAVRGKAEALASLEADWDDAGAPPIRPDTLRAASRLLSLLEPGIVAPDDVYALSDGHILVEWRQGKTPRVQVEIGETGRAELMVVPPEGPSRFTAMAWDAVPSEADEAARAAIRDALERAGR